MYKRFCTYVYVCINVFVPMCTYVVIWNYYNACVENKDVDIVKIEDAFGYNVFRYLPDKINLQWLWIINI